MAWGRNRNLRIPEKTSFEVGRGGNISSQIFWGGGASNPDEVKLASKILLASAPLVTLLLLLIIGPLVWGGVWSPLTWTFFLIASCMHICTNTNANTNGAKRCWSLFTLAKDKIQILQHKSMTCATMFSLFQLILCYSITGHFLLCSKTEPFMSTESMALPCTCDNNIMYF